MSSHKTTVELEKSLEQLQSEITGIEIEIGSLLFAREAQEVSQHHDAYRAFEDRKERLCADIEAIRSLAERRQFFRADADSLRQQMDVLATHWPPLYERLGAAIADAPDAVYSDAFDPFREPIAELRRKDAEARVALDNLKDQMANQSFMNRLLTQVQYTARNKAVSQLEKKMAGLYVKCGRAVFDSGVLEGPFQEQRLAPAVGESYMECQELQVKVSHLQQQIDVCWQRIDENKQELAAKGVTSDNPDKRIKAITNEVDQEVLGQRELCKLVGHEFCASYLDPEGEFTAAYSGEQQDVFQSKLERVAELMRNGALCRRKIQIVDISEQIDVITKKIYSYRASIAENEEKIGEIQERIQELEKKISSTLLEKDRLLFQLNELELADSQDTKRLEE